MALAALNLGIGAATSAQDKPAAETAANAPTPAMTVYDTVLGAGWQNWSWAKTELSVELQGSARRPIKVEAGPYQALYLHHDAFSTTGLKQLGLLIQGSAPAGEVRVFTLTDGKVNGEGRLVKLGNSGWTQVVMPLAELAAEDKVIDGIWVQNASGADLPKFYVTEIRLE
jgi:hypothetical protein